MFHLHQRTRRHVCRAVFLGGCVTPIVALLVWAVTLELPGHVRSYETTLSRQLGLQVTLDGVSHPRPGATRYRGLVLSNLETGEPLLHIDRLDSHVADGALVLSASGTKIEATRLGALWEVVAGRLRTPAARQVRLWAGQVVYSDETTSHTFTDVRGGWEPSETGTQASLRFRMEGVSMESPVRLRAIRNRQTTPPATLFELDTGGVPLPSTLAATLFPQLARLGPDSRFRGHLWATRQPDRSWDGELTGELTGVELGRLITDQFPHRLDGTARIVIRRARLLRGRLEIATGSLAAGPGLISPSLLSAAVDALYLMPGKIPQPADGDVPYQQLGLAFDVSDAGLSIRGICQGFAAGTVLTSRSAVLLSEPRYGRLPIVALVRMLVPRIEVLVPATRETDVLARRLPLPRAAKPHHRTATPSKPGSPPGGSVPP